MTARRLWWLCAAVAGLLIAPAAAVAPAVAQASTAYDTGVSDPVEVAAHAYLSVYPQMSSAAARAAAAQQQARKQIVSAVLAESPDAFGGAWFDPPSGTYHLAVKTAGAESRVTSLADRLGVRVKTHRVTRSFAALESAAASLRAGAGEVGAAANGQVGIDVTTNTVTVAMPAAVLPGLRSHAAAGVTLLADLNLPSQEDECSARDACADDLRSGLVIRRPGSGCSLGFTARGSDGVRWALTAGHCNGGGAETWSTAGVEIGGLDPQNSRNSGEVDASAIQVTNPDFADDHEGRIYLSGTGHLPVNGSAPNLAYIVPGETVCLSARYAAPGTTGNPCAVVSLVADPFKRGLVRVDGYDGCPGDSGGGWYWLSSDGRRIAYGLHSRSNEGCNQGSVSWFSALPSFWTALTYETS